MKEVMEVLWEALAGLLIAAIVFLFLVYVWLFSGGTAVYPLPFAVVALLVGFAGAVQGDRERRARRRAQLEAAAFLKIEEAARAVLRARLPADRAPALVRLERSIADAGRIGTPSPILTLPADSRANIDTSIGAIEADASHRRGVAEAAARRRAVRTWAFNVIAFVVAAAGLVVGIIALN